jgi:hypothetical protein
VDPVFRWIEASALSRWVTGDAFMSVLVLHTLGVALVAGPSLAIALRLLGAARGAPLGAFAGFFPVVWIGLLAAAPSGVLLLIGYPTKALTNPVFYLKLVCIALGLGLLLRIRSRVLLTADDGETRASGGAAMLAWASLALWTGAIVAGRLLAYTYTRLTADF